MSHTEKQDVTYYIGHEIEVNGKRYVTKRTCHKEKVVLDFDKDVWTDIPDFVEAYQFKCSQCGETLDDNYVYCPKCGAKIDEDS